MHVVHTTIRHRLSVNVDCNTRKETAVGVGRALVVVSVVC